jgi:proline dehydrogenase
MSLLSSCSGRVPSTGAATIRSFAEGVGMRRLFLWLAGNAWLRERFPRLPLAQRAVRRFMPGEHRDDALAASTTFQGQGISVLLTRLGENLGRIEEADEVAAEYQRLIDGAAARGLDAEVSVKLTQLGFDLDQERTFEHVSELAGRAATHAQTVWVDMESSPYTESTIAFYERLKAVHPNTGVCLQAYLHRTAADIQRLLPLSPSIRLVKGAYAEPATLAWQAKREVDASYAGLVVSMLEAKRQGCEIRIGLGTHDVALIEQLDGQARAIGLPRTSFEVQMLYGIRVDEQIRLAREGYLVRDLVAYGEAWYPWYLRRLAERPANVLFVMRQVLPW